jgi:hypothetical protein
MEERSPDRPAVDPPSPRLRRASWRPPLFAGSPRDEYVRMAGKIAASRARWKPFVEHQVHKHTCKGDIEPNWDCPTCDSLVAVPSATKNLKERHNHQRQCDKGKQNMRSQYREVNGSDPPCVPRRFFAYTGMIDNVARQETSRGNHGRDHAGHVPAPRAMTDEVPAH